MQIQADFVTNSSSTGYIIFVPDIYYASESAIQLAIKMTEADHGNTNMSDHNKEIDIPEVIELMKSGETYYYGEFVGYANDNMVWLVCLQLFTTEDFIIGAFEIGSDGNTCMTGVDQKNITDVLTKHVDLDDLVKTLIKGADDERQNPE